ncbi:hypothetical protein CAI21_16080 [Alkalilimnicola ehrlichii]|uniref:PAS domain S-box protein n=1 Tax=Alkalilimnicola ehrlichii TaxID=351052 RepID=A0A3E0WPL7_9GAMM|nr:PAS domain S-box protein [Alkalilimnicola ehrlichii]RFA26800.1 hypothetical protein CAI21_16080 [Alkalilimnicola ehrlichii]RFA33895.1 hypothetical protein CAL65_16200 [Alkalilimnicola ehrlichii]
MPQDQEPASKLAQLLRERQTEILGRWIEATNAIPALDRLSDPALTSHLTAVIRRIVNALENPDQNRTEAKDKTPQPHDKMRLRQGISLRQMMREHRLLREIVLSLWSDQTPSGDTPTYLSLSAAMDDVFEAMIEEYIVRRDEAIRASLSASVQHDDNDNAFLRSALNAALAWAGTAQTATVWLTRRDGFEQVFSTDERREAVATPPIADVARSGKPSFVHRPQAESCFLPMLAGEHCLGVLEVIGPVLTEPDRHLFRVVADQLATTLHLLAIRQQQRERARSLEQTVDIIEKGDPLMVVDRDWRIIYVNRGQERLSKTPRSKTLGKTLWQMFSLRPDRVQFYRRIMRERSEAFFETYYPPLDLWMDISVYPTSQGGLALFLRDINRRKRAEEALANAEARISLLVDSVEDYAIVLIDQRGRIASWNKGAARMTGWTAAQAIGCTGDLFKPRQSAAPSIEKLLEKAVTEGSAHLEGWHCRRDGSRFWIDATLSPIQVSDKQAPQFALVARDLTTSRQREESLRFLEEAGRVLAQSLEFSQTAELVANLAVPRLADWCVVDYLVDKQLTRPLAVAHTNPTKVRWANELREHFPPILRLSSASTKSSAQANPN